jgi:SAM-dependent methyltransferase
MGSSPPRRNALDITHLPPAEYVHHIGQRYVAGNTPWDSGTPNAELIRQIEAGKLPGKTVLEMGCGTGTNAVELARRGYRVTAVDLTPIAIERAREKATKAGVSVDFRAGDLTRLDLGGPYDCLLDIGLYHGIRNRDLVGFRSTLQRVSRPGTRWLSLAGNAKEISTEGPPVVREEEIRSELGPMFKILELHEIRFDLRPDFQPLAWSILMERR